MSSDPLVPSQSPFNYNVGINYETWESGRTGYSIPNDLNQIDDNFKLIKTFHDMAVGTSDPTNPIIEPTQKPVIEYVVANPGTELVMGTFNSALAQGGFGTPWEPGLMVDPAYTDKWVAEIVKTFGSKDAVKLGLKTILLGNEIDQAGPPPGDPDFDTYVNEWVPKSFDNLKASLEKAGLGSIPVSTTIANYGPTNEVSVKIPQHIVDNWGADWNNGEPFVLFNQYTQNNGQSTDYNQVIDYFNGVETALGSSLEPFIGETGYSTFYGADNQATVYGDIFTWLEGQRSDGGKTVPLFTFTAFDRPDVAPAWEPEYGIYAETGNSQPNGLKTNLQGVIPAWTDDPINGSTDGNDALYGSRKGEALVGRGGHDTLHGDRGEDRLAGRDGDDLIFGGMGADVLLGQKGEDTLRGSNAADLLKGGTGDDILRGNRGADTLDGGPGADTLIGGRGDDIFVVDAVGLDVIRGFEADDTLALADGLSAADLVIAEDGKHTTLSFDGEVIVRFLDSDVALIEAETFVPFA